MRFIKRWSRTATAVAVGALVLGGGTVAAQSQGEDPWWWNVFATGPTYFQSTDGEVSIDTDNPLGFDIMSGNLGKAKANFEETGEYIGCQILTNPTDGQYVMCAARDRYGNTLYCESQFVQSTFLLREHMLLNAAVNLTDSHYISVNVDRVTGQCRSIQVMASSADFLADRESPTSACTEANSVDLGAFGGSPISVPNDACVKVTRFAKPFWQYGPNRTMQLQNPSGTAYPTPYEFEQSCTNATGSGQFDGNFDDQYLPGISDACPLFIHLMGNGNGIISLRYW